MGKAKKAGRGRPIQPLGSSLGLVNPFKAKQDHKSARNLSTPAQLSRKTLVGPANEEQSSNAATNAPHAPLRSANDNWSPSHSVGVIEDLTQSDDTVAFNPPAKDIKESFASEKLSSHVVGESTTPMAIQSHAFDSQFETVHRTHTGNSLHCSILTLTEYLNHGQGGHLIYDGTGNHINSSLTLNSAVYKSANILDNGLLQPSADVLDFLELRRNFNTWLQLSRLRNEGRHPPLKQYIAAVLEEFEDGYKDLEDKLAEKLFPVSGVRYEKAGR